MLCRAKRPLPHLILMSGLDILKFTASKQEGLGMRMWVMVLLPNLQMP